MAGVILNTIFNNAALPTSKSLVEQISTIPGLLGWFQGDSAKVEIDQGGIAGFNDVAGSSARFYRDSAENQAEVISNDLATYSAAVFNPAESANGKSDSYSLLNATLSPDSPYTYVAVFKQSANPENTGGDTIVGRYVSSASRAMVNIGGGATEVTFLHGDTFAHRHPIQKEQWHVVIASFDGTNLKFIGDDVTYESRVASGSTGSSAVRLGALSASGDQSFEGSISDVMLFQSDVIGTEDSLNLIKAYMKSVYGLVM